MQEYKTIRKAKITKAVIISDSILLFKCSVLFSVKTHNFDNVIKENP